MRPVSIIKTPQPILKLLFVVFVSLCSICALIYVVASLMISNRNDTFCTDTDPLYLYINSNKVEWIASWKQLTPTLEGTYPAMQITSPTNQYGLVRPYHSDVSRNPEFYVIVEGRWPGTYSYGSKGYWYSPSDDKDTSTRISYTYLGEDIYCYWFK
jgi:hypothetical protein